MPAQTPAMTRSSVARREGAAAASRLIVRRVDAKRPRADVRVEHEHAPAVLRDAPVDVVPVRRRRRAGSTSPNCVSPWTRTATSGGTITSSLPTSTRAFDVRLCRRETARRSGRGRSLPMPEAVVVAEILDAGDVVRPLADAAADVDVDDRGEDRRRDEHERDERGDRDRRARRKRGGCGASREPRAAFASVARLGLALTRDPEDRGARDQEHDPGVAAGPERRVREEDRRRRRRESRSRSAARAGRAGCGAPP